MKKKVVTHLNNGAQLVSQVEGLHPPVKRREEPLSTVKDILPLLILMPRITTVVEPSMLMKLEALRSTQSLDGDIGGIGMNLL